MVTERAFPGVLRLAALLMVAAVAAGCASEASSAPMELATPVEMDAPTAPGSAEPDLATDGQGRVYLTWQEPAGDSAHALRFAVLEDDRWTEPRTIARGADWFVNWADFPSLVVLPGGRLAAHYLERHPGASKGYEYGVRVVQSSDGGSTWSRPVTPHRDGVAAEHGFVSMFAAGGDSLGVVWLDGRKYAPGGTEEMELRYTALSPEGGAGPEVVLDARVCDCCQTAHTRTSRGSLVVYRGRTADEIRDIQVVRREGGRWTQPRPVHADGWRMPACPVNGPAVAADGERVAVAWFTAARDTARVLVAFSDDAGESFGAPVRVDAGEPAGRVDVELLSGGRAVVSWLERTGEQGAEVRARVVGDRGEMGPERLIARSSGARASGFPRMARGADALFFAWTEPEPPSRIRVARLNLEGE